MALHLPINAECNIQCSFCSSAGRGGDFSLESLKVLVAKDRTGHVQVSGGEPFLREPAELLELLAFCRKQGKIVEFQTNAVLVSRLDEKVLSLISRLVSFFNVNFSAHTPALDEVVTGVAGGFERRIDGIRRILQLGAKLRLTYIIHKDNMAHAAEFAEFAAREFPGIAWLQFSFVKGMGRAKGSSAVIPSFDEAAPFVNAALSRCLALGLAVEVDHIPACFVREFLEVHADYRKMREGRPGVHLEEKRKTGDCEGCSLAPFCPGPRLDYLELHGSLRS